MQTWYVHSFFSGQSSNLTDLFLGQYAVRENNRICRFLGGSDWKEKIARSSKQISAVGTVGWGKKTNQNKS